MDLIHKILLGIAVFSVPAMYVCVMSLRKKRIEKTDQQNKERAEMLQGCWEDLDLLETGMTEAREHCDNLTLYAKGLEEKLYQHTRLLVQAKADVVRAERGRTTRVRKTAGNNCESDREIYENIENFYQNFVYEIGNDYTYLNNRTLKKTPLKGLILSSFPDPWKGEWERKSGRYNIEFK
jgi:hypothetical protein